MACSKPPSLPACSWSDRRILTHGLKTRPGGAEVGVALGVAAVYLLLFLPMATSEARTHLIEYCAVAVLHP